MADTNAPQAWGAALLDISDPDTAASVHAIGIDSYRVEADLIGSNLIPALQEDVRTMQRRALNWAGAVGPNHELGGFVAFKHLEDGHLDIDRLCVAPTRFRQGLGRMLIRHVLDSNPGLVTVSTGEATAPAVILYLSLGFRALRVVEPVAGLRVVEFERRSLGG